MNQPDPKPNDSTPIWELIVKDMQARDQLGRERYGVPLQAGNGRDSLQDAYEEALDLVAYLRTEIENRKQVQVFTVPIENLIPYDEWEKSVRDQLVMAALACRELKCEIKGGDK